jgi:hypothetical protein
MLKVRTWVGKFCYVGGAEPPGASLGPKSATSLMEVFEGGGMNHDDSSRGNGRCEAGEERVGDESRGKKAVSRVVGLSAATSSGGEKQTPCAERLGMQMVEENRVSGSNNR